MSFAKTFASSKLASAKVAFSFALAFSEGSPSPKLALAFSKTGLSFSLAIAFAKVGSLARALAIVGHWTISGTMPFGTADKAAIIALAFSTVVLLSWSVIGFVCGLLGIS